MNKPSQKDTEYIVDNITKGFSGQASREFMSLLNSFQTKSLGPNTFESVLAPLSVLILINKHLLDYNIPENEKPPIVTLTQRIEDHYIDNDRHYIDSEYIEDCISEICNQAEIPFRFISPILRNIKSIIEENPEIFYKMAAFADNITLMDFDIFRTRDNYELLIKLTLEQDKRRAGNHVTPDVVRELMVGLLRPQPGESVYDPCFGFGGLLTDSVVAINNINKQINYRKKLPVKPKIAGVEINPFAFIVGACRLTLAGVKYSELYQEDALGQPTRRSKGQIKKYDAIIAAPPWGGKDGEHKKAQFPISTSKAEGVFLQHILKSLSPKGRAVIVLPQGFMYGSGPEKRIRQLIAQEYGLTAVIDLPSGVMKPFTNASASILCIDRQQRSNSVKMVQASSKILSQESASKEIQDILTFIEGDVQNLIQEPASLNTQNKFQVSIDQLQKNEFIYQTSRYLRNELIHELEALQKRKPNLEITNLNKLATIHSGASYSTQLDPEDNVITYPIIRIGDIQDGELRLPSNFPTRRISGQVPERSIVKNNDILFSLVGTVAKTCRINEFHEEQEYIAGQNLAILRPKNESTATLLDQLFRTSEYQDYFSKHAFGAGVQHITIRQLKDTPIPLLNSDDVRSLWRSKEPSLRSSLSFEPLIRVDIFEDYFGFLVGRIHEFINSKTEKSYSDIIDDIGQSIQRKIGDLKSDIMGTEELQIAERLQIIGEMLSRFSLIGKGSAQLVILHSVSEILDQGLQQNKSSQGNFTNFRDELLTAIQDSVYASRGEILHNIKVKLSFHEEYFQPGKQEYELSTWNVSKCDLLNLSLHVSGVESPMYIPFVAEDQIFKTKIVLNIEDTAAEVNININWEAQGLDMEWRSGSEKLSLLPAPPLQREYEPFGENPYLIGKPVRHKNMFFGRDKILADIRIHLENSSTEIPIILEGNRRSGKTSILEQIKASDFIKGQIPVYFDFQGGPGSEEAEGIPTIDLFHFIMHGICVEVSRHGILLEADGIKAVKDNLSRPSHLKKLVAEIRKNLENENPSTVFIQFMTNCIDAIKPLRLILLLDEFYKIYQGISNKVTSPQVLDNFRHIIQHLAGFTVILTLTKQLQQLRQDYWSTLYDLGYQIDVGEISAEDAKALITVPVKGRLTFQEAAIDSLIEYSGRMPYLIQAMCIRIFNHAESENERVITMEIVDQVAAETAKLTNHFRTIWRYPNKARHRLLLAVCHKYGQENESVDLEFIIDQLAELGVYVPSKRIVADDLKALRALGLLKLDQGHRGGSYLIQNKLFDLWIENEIDFNDILLRAKEEGEALL